MQIEEIIEEFKGKGLKDEEILVELQKLVEEGKMSEEDLAKAKELLEKANEMDKRKDAEDLFGVKFVD